MKFLYEIDEKILDSFEYFSHFTQRFIGMTNFDIARYSSLLGIVCDVVFFLFLCVPSRPDALFVPLVLFVALLGLIFVVEKDAEHTIKAGFVNSCRIDWQGIRVLFVLLVALHSGMSVCLFLFTDSAIEVWIDLSSICRCLVFYLLSCTPLPPAPSRLSEFFSKFKLTPLSEV